MEKVIYNKGSEVLKRGVQRGGGCPVLGDIQAGQGSENLMEL